MSPKHSAIAAVLQSLWHFIICPVPPQAARLQRPDRGDVPGWVLITLMTAGLVVALWALAGEAFTSLFEDAMNRVRRAG